MREQGGSSSSGIRRVELKYRQAVADQGSGGHQKVPGGQLVPARESLSQQEAEVLTAASCCLLTLAVAGWTRACGWCRRRRRSERRRRRRQRRARCWKDSVSEGIARSESSLGLADSCYAERKPGQKKLPSKAPRSDRKQPASMLLISGPGPDF